jgi:crotonobetainyl-CoA:carnitine CoA-transferase CaiB-like acyl-CoA transferase
MFDAAAAWVADDVNAALNDVEIAFEGWEDAVRHQVYRTADGKLVLFQASEDKFWVNFCRALGREDLLEGHERRAVGAHARGDEPLRRALTEIFATKTRAEWIAFFLEHNVAGSPLNSTEELLADPHFRARGLVFEQTPAGQSSTRWFSTPIKYEDQQFSATPAPFPGEHTEDVLQRVLGYDTGRSAALRASGAIARTSEG